MLERIEPKDRDMFEAMLTDPLPGRERRSSAVEEQDGAGFMALYQQTGGRG